MHVQCSCLTVPKVMLFMYTLWNTSVNCLKWSFNQILSVNFLNEKVCADCKRKWLIQIILSCPLGHWLSICKWSCLSHQGNRKAQCVHNNPRVALKEQSEIQTSQFWQWIHQILMLHADIYIYTLMHELFMLHSFTRIVSLRKCHQWHHDAMMLSV